ncbi:MAG: methionyl-tRNA formyltransferase, partial [Flavitalea sp.]
PVKKYAVEKNIEVLQPPKLKEPEFIKSLSNLNADLQIVVAFRMLPEIVWNMPPMGTVNVHGSLLPQYRGAAPINWAVINGEKETGVTTFKLQHAIDTGNILMKEVIPIGEDENAGSVHDRMKEIGAQLLVKTIKGLAEGSIKEITQDDITGGALKHAPKIFTETCKIDWNKPVSEIYNLIRGLSPYPGAFTSLNDKMFKIFTASKNIETHSREIGSMETDGKTFIRFYGIDGSIDCKEIQLEGKKRMNVEEFLRGYKL